jgi:ferric-chelate reductase [NAD(P)H]
MINSQEKKSDLIDPTCLYKIQYGMYVITTVWENKINGQIATTLFQVANQPIQVAICLSNNTYTCELMKKSLVFGAAILEQDTPMKFIGNFGYRCGRSFDKFCSIKYETNLTNCPLILDNSLVILEGKINTTLNIGSHSIFVGELTSAKKIKDGIAMTYEYYHTVIKGKSPENAPTYLKPI